MKNTEELIRELLDREAIRDLPKRYCHCVWTNDLDGIVNLFSDDGSIIMESSKGPQTTTGHDKLRKAFRRVVDDLGPRPYIHNHVIELKDASHATGTCYVELRDSKHDMKWLGTGYYNDEYVKAGDQWKFKSRRRNAGPHGTPTATLAILSRTGRDPSEGAARASFFSQLAGAAPEEISDCSAVLVRQ